MRAGTRTPEDIKVKGQLGPRALRVLIRVQELVSARGAYDYVEIGSFMGRSLQSHLQDDDCRRALSIDLRPDSTPDERGTMDIYQGITADDMIAGLAEVCSAKDLAKLETVTNSSDVLRDMDPDQFDLAFIDGEHTHTAAFRDFLNVLGVIRANGVICFDDTTLVLTGIRNALTVLETRGVPHAVAFGRGGITVVALGDGAEAFVQGLDDEMTLSEGRVERRTRRRMQEVALREAKPHLIANDGPVRAKVIAALRANGWVVEPASTNEPA